MIFGLNLKKFANDPESTERYHLNNFEVSKFVEKTKKNLNVFQKEANI